MGGGAQHAESVVSVPVLALACCIAVGAIVVVAPVRGYWAAAAVHTTGTVVVGVGAHRIGVTAARAEAARDGGGG